MFIKSINSTLQLDPMRRIMQEDKNKIVQLYEIRSDIEQASARTAALARNTEDLLEIQQCLENFESNTGETRFAWALDQAFHTAVARASHNFFRVHVIISIFDFSKEFIQPIIEGFAATRENAAIIAGQHTAIFRAIEKKQAEQAGESMKAHLNWTNQQLVEHLQAAVDNP